MPIAEDISLTATQASPFEVPAFAGCTREWAVVLQAPTASDCAMAVRRAGELPPFNVYLARLCCERDIAPECAFKRGGIERTYGYRIMRGERNPSRNTAIMFAFGLGLAFPKVQDLLAAARVAPLNPGVRRDAVIAWCLHRHKTFVAAQIDLDGLGLPLLSNVR
ncbi:hypothetical protein [Curtanaerobium respiraculi]|uniref:hypothetical protein n=1 Tax=Curtanaerobium respiraculi TaxID=2949669 RepID=UPI0024B334F2|nr:hypothetical protein [Curtanaerobium respiraculi]